MKLSKLKIFVSFIFLVFVALPLVYMYFMTAPKLKDMCELLRQQPSLEAAENLSIQKDWEVRAKRDGVSFWAIAPNTRGQSSCKVIKKGNLLTVEEVHSD